MASKLDISIREIKENDHKCESCEKYFSSAFNLQRHFEGVHKKIKNHLCDSCDTKFQFKCELMKHIRSKHEKSEPQICKFCEQSFSNRPNLKRHIATFMKIKEMNNVTLVTKHLTQKGFWKAI